MINIKESFLQCKKKPVKKDLKAIDNQHKKIIKTFKQEPKQDKIQMANEWKQKRLKLIREDFSVFFKSSEFLAKIYRQYEIENDKGLFQQIFKFVLIKFLNNRSDLFTNKYQLELLEEYMQDEFKKEFVDKLNRLFVDKNSKFKGINSSLVLIGSSGIGKKTLVQSYCNSNDIIINLRQFVEHYGNTNKFQNLFFDYREKQITKSDEKKKKDKNQDQLNYSGSKKKINISKQKNKTSIRNPQLTKKGQVSLLSYFNKSEENENKKQLVDFINKSKQKKLKIKDYFNNEKNLQNIDMLQKVKLRKIFMCYNFEFLEEKCQNEINNQLKQITQFVNQSQFPYVFVLGQKCQKVFQILKKQSSIVHMKKNSFEQNYYFILSILIIEYNFRELKNINFQEIKEIEDKIMNFKNIIMPNKFFLDILIQDIEVNWNCYLNLCQFYLDQFFQNQTNDNLLYQQILLQFNKNKKQYDIYNYLQHIQYVMNKQEIFQIKHSKNIHQQSLLNFFGQTQINKENNCIQQKNTVQSQTKQPNFFKTKTQNLQDDYVLINYYENEANNCIKDLDLHNIELEQLLLIDQNLDDNLVSLKNLYLIEQANTIDQIIKQRKKEFFPIRLLSFEFDYFYQLIYLNFTIEFFQQIMSDYPIKKSSNQNLKSQALTEEQFQCISDEIETKINNLANLLKNSQKKQKIMEDFIQNIFLQIASFQNKDNKIAFNGTFDSDTLNLTLTQQMEFINLYFKYQKQINSYFLKIQRNKDNDQIAENKKKDNKSKKKENSDIYDESCDNVFKNNRRKKFQTSFIQSTDKIQYTRKHKINTSNMSDDYLDNIDFSQERVKHFADQLFYIIIKNFTFEINCNINELFFI